MDKTEQNIFKEIEKLMLLPHQHFKIIVAEGKPLIQDGEFNRSCDKCLEINELRAKLEGYQLAQKETAEKVEVQRNEMV